MISPFEPIEVEKKSDFGQLFSLMHSDCDECENVTSPCCSREVNLMFGTLPVEVKCSGCGNNYLLRDIIKKASGDLK